LGWEENGPLLPTLQQGTDPRRLHTRRLIDFNGVGNGASEPTTPDVMSRELLLEAKTMQHEDQHIEAIKRTVKAKNEVSAEIFDDKVKPMGFATVEKGKISIKLDYVPSMITAEARRDFIVDAISLSLKACFDANPDAFDPYAQS
jgi:hypothetical protein